MSRAALALVVLFVGCGDVTAQQLGPEGGASDGQPLDSGTRVEAPGALSDRSESDAGAVEVPPSGPSCDQAAACAACAPYPCAAVIACARSGDAGAYPWQSCHNINAAGFPLEGQLCAMHAACP